MIDRYTRSHGIRLNVATEMDALNQIKTMVSRGSGYTILAPAAAIDFVGARRAGHDPHRRAPHGSARSTLCATPPSR